MKKIIFRFCAVFLCMVLSVMIKNGIEFRNAIELRSEQIIKLPSIDRISEGFTCTGLYYDFMTNTFYVGNAGKVHINDEQFKATIEQISFDFKEIVHSIECYKTYPNMKDIQGVALDGERTIWFCSYGEDLVRNISQDGKEISEFRVEKPSGIAYDNHTDSLWVLTNKELANYSKTGDRIDSFRIRKKGQDQLFIDEKNDLIYFTGGTNYQGENYVYTFNVKTKKTMLKYVLKDSYAVEGIAIIGDRMYILNDGYYHDAKVDVNQVNIYRIN